MQAVRWRAGPGLNGLADVLAREEQGLPPVLRTDRHAHATTTLSFNRREYDPTNRSGDANTAAWTNMDEGGIRPDARALRPVVEGTAATVADERFAQLPVPGRLDAASWASERILEL